MTPSEAVDTLMGLLDPSNDSEIRLEAATELVSRARPFDEQG